MFFFAFDEGPFPFWLVLDTFPPLVPEQADRPPPLAYLAPIGGLPARHFPSPSRRDFAGFEYRDDASDLLPSFIFYASLLSTSVPVLLVPLSS